MKTQGLKQALDKYGFDAAFGGARRDEEKSRAKERIFSFRSAQHRWDPKNQRPELWQPLQRAQAQGREHPRLPAVELDRARRLAVHLPARTSRSCRSTSPSERPVVERDGTLIMVDDERMPLRPGETPQMKKVRFRTLGCYPLTGAVESEADTLPAIIQEMLLDDDLRAPGPRHRPRRGGVDGEEEAGGLFLMAHAVRAHRRRHRRVPRSRTSTRSLLRFITCGSVDDGKCTLIGRLLYESQADLRGPAGGARGRLEEGRHPGRRARLRAAGRRPGRRARAGHHHRRRLPLLLHRQAQVHRRRHARATSSTRATW